MASLDAATDKRAGGEVRLLPGPDRKKSLRDYHFRLIYRNDESATVGCVMLWEVTGGRLPYQIAWERTAAGKSVLHCTCADAVFRGESEGRYCKHVLGLLGREGTNAA